MFIQVENSRCIGAASEDGMDCERPPDQEEAALRFGRGAVPSPAQGVERRASLDGLCPLLASGGIFRNRRTAGTRDPFGRIFTPGKVPATP